MLLTRNPATLVVGGSVNVKYRQPSIFSLVDLKNNEGRGCISITSNLISLRGTSNPPENELEFFILADGDWEWDLFDFETDVLREHN